jgi:hypothetical protein
MTRSGNLVGALGAFALLIAVSLSGCSAAPSTSPVPSQPAAESPGAPASIVISADGVAVLDAAGTPVGTEDFLGGADGLVTLLEGALGPATPAEPGAESCSTATVYTWGDDHAVAVAESTEDGPAPLTVSTKVDELEGIRIVTSTGFAVGDDVSAVLESLPADQMNEAIQFIWELNARSGSEPFGGWAFADYDTHLVYGIGAPGVLGSGYC